MTDMDTDDIIRQVNERHQAFIHSSSFHDFFRTIFCAHEAPMREFVRWRILFNIEPGALADKALAFLIHRTQRYHPHDWQTRLDRLMERAVQRPPGEYEPFLFTYVRGLEARMLRAILKGEEPSPYAEDAIKERLTLISEVIRRVHNGARGFSLAGPPAEFMPDWYFIARPEYDEYHKAGLEELVSPLVTPAADETSQLLNTLHELLRKHAWRPAFERVYHPALLEIKRLVGLERSSFETVSQEASSTLPQTVPADISRLRAQRRQRLQQFAGDIETIQGIPDKATYDRIATILAELCRDL